MKQLAFSLLICLLWSCNQQNKQQQNIQYQNIEKSLQARLIMANNNDTIQLPKGHFSFSRSLLMEGKKNIVIKGQGIDKTVLSFKNQTEGAEGLRITNCQNITLEDFTIEDSPGDNIKVMETNWITFRRIKTNWNGEPGPTNGAYGLYPVKCNNVLIEGCVARGASDAGIYVGQSNYAIIRHNKVFENVAGIESENTRFADIYGNEVWDNTGGILVFDLPGLSQYGENVRVFDNQVRSNNFKNFAPAGNIVSVIPPGTGILVLATKNVEVFNNNILHNKTVGTGLVSYILINEVSKSKDDQPSQGTTQTVNRNFEEDKNYNPYVRNVFVHNNKYQNKHLFPTLSSDFGKLFLYKFPFNTPDIVYDGIRDPSDKESSICIHKNGEITFANLDAANEFKALTTELSSFNCKGKKVKVVKFQPLQAVGKETKQAFLKP